MSESLTKKSTRGLIWSGVERLSWQLISFTLALVLARLVTPADYGLLAVVMVFVTISGIVVDAGFANALIRKADCTDLDRSTVLYFNVAVSIILYGVLYLSAPLIARTYANMELVALLRCASIIVVINALGVVQQAVLTSRIDFKRQTSISLVSSLASGSAALLLAYRGYGVWALVLYSILSSLIRVLMLWIVVAWRPRLAFSVDSFRDLFGYSYKLMFSNLIVQGSRQLVQLILGGFYSISDLGYYNYANRLGSFAPHHLSTSIQRVLFPIFSQIQNDEEKLVASFRKSLVLSMAIIVPVACGLASLADPIITILLTPEWVATLPLLRVVCVTMAIWPLLYFNMNILWVKKRSDISLRLEAINITLRILIVLALFKLGILWVCVALALAELLNFVIYARCVGRVISYSLGRQLADLYPIYVVAAAAAIVTHAAAQQIAEPVIALIVGVVVMALLYCGLLILVRGYIFYAFKSILRERGLLK